MFKISGQHGCPVRQRRVDSEGGCCRPLEMDGLEPSGSVPIAVTRTGLVLFADTFAICPKRPTVIP